MTFSLAMSKFFPFRKPNSVPLCINVKVNHPSTIIKDVLKVTNKRLSELSCHKDEFRESKAVIQKIIARKWV